MTLFLLFFIPLTAVFILRVFFRESFYRSDTWLVAFRGLLAFLISILPIYIIIQSYGVKYVRSALYFRFLLADFLILLLPLLLFYFFWERRKIEYEYGQRLFIHIFAFVNGYFALIGVFAGFLHFGFYSGYRLFGYPLLLMLADLSVILGLYLYSAGGDWKRYVSFVLVLAVLVLSAFVPFLIQLSYIFWGTFSCLFLSFSAVGVLYLLYRKRIIPTE